MKDGSALFTAGRYADAIGTFEKARDAARAGKLPNIAARALGNIGGCQFALHQYQPALHSFIDAVHAAEEAQDLSAAAIFNANIASLYSEMGDFDNAAEWTEASLRHLSDKDRRAYEPQLQIQLATLRARQHRMPEAVALFSRGLDAADLKGDLELYANGWNRLGEEYLKQHDLAGAEPPLLEAYRIRLLNHLALDSSYRSLGLLRMEQGDLRARARCWIVPSNLPPVRAEPSPHGTSITSAAGCVWPKAACATPSGICGLPAVWLADGAGVHLPTTPLE